MKLRIIYGTFAMSILIAMPVIGSTAQIVGGGLCIMLCAYELVNVVKHHNHTKPSLLICYFYIATSLASYYYIGFLGIFFSFAIFSMLSLVRPIINEKIFQNDVATSLFVLVYPCSLGLFFALTGYLPDKFAPLGMLAIGFYASMVDVMAFCVGSLFGKHKLIERISPNKTVEGAVGGFFGGIIASFILYYWVQPILGTNVALYDYLILGSFCGIFAQLGDLVASFIKRSTEIKDFSNLLPGHGGILDRFDSLLFCAPIVFTYLYFIAKIG